MKGTGRRTQTETETQRQKNRYRQRQKDRIDLVTFFQSLANKSFASAPKNDKKKARQKTGGKMAQQREKMANVKGKKGHII